MHNIFYKIDMNVAHYRHHDPIQTYTQPPVNNCLSKLFITMEISSRNKAQVNKTHYFNWPWTQYLCHRSVQFPHHTQTSSNSPTIEADSSNGYVHTSLFDRTYCIFRRK